MESQGIETHPLYTFEEIPGNNKTGYTTPQYVHFDETPTALESQGMDDKMLKVQDVRALESQGRHSSRAHNIIPPGPNTTGRTSTITPNTFNALESQETSHTSHDDLSALESQGREEKGPLKLDTSLESEGAVCTPPAKFNALESQGVVCTPPAKFDALESQEMNTISSAASKEVLCGSSVSAMCKSSALESQGKDDDSLSQAVMFGTPFPNDPRLCGETTSTSLSQESKVASGSDNDGEAYSSNSRGVVFTDSAAPSSCFVGFRPSTKVITLDPMVHEVERWKPIFIGPSKTVLVYKHQPAPAPPIYKRFFAPMEAKYDYLVQIE